MSARLVHPVLLAPRARWVPKDRPDIKVRREMPVSQGLQGLTARRDRSARQGRRVHKGLKAKSASLVQLGRPVRSEKEVLLGRRDLRVSPVRIFAWSLTRTPATATMTNS